MNDRANIAATLENSAFFMPFSMNRQFKKTPRLLARAEGMYYYTPEGRKILDGTAGLWCVNAGHCRKKIVDAVARGVATLDFAPPFQMGHPLAFEFADRVVQVAPKGMTKVFFTNSGSESVDTALSRQPPPGSRDFAAKAPGSASFSSTPRPSGGLAPLSGPKRAR